MEPIGVHSFWGFSPAVDLQQLYRTAFGSGAWGSDGAAAPAEPLSILLVQPGDPRSVLKTIAQRFRHSGRPLHFYIYERAPEQLARHLALLSIATDWELPIRARAHLWLEVYGNALVQARTAAYLAQRRALLADLLCSGRGPAPLPALLDAHSLLRHRQRDEVEGALKTWAEGCAFDVALYRDTRVRGALGARYDSLENVADWDYQMVVRPCAGCVHGRQYRAWRASGLAFEYGDQTYDRPNRTLGSYAEARARRRGSVMARGYWGDTVVSPFHAVGTAAYVPTDSEARAAAAAAAAAAADATPPTSSSSSVRQGPCKNFAGCLFDILNRRYGSEQWRHHAVEIATYNLLAWLTEIETGSLYVMRTENDIYSGLPAAAVAAPSASAPAHAPEPQGAAGAVVDSGGVLEPGDSAPAEAAAPETAGAAAATEAAAAPSAGGAVSAAAAPPPPTPPPALTPAEAAAVEASVRAAALRRARTISRAFKGVTVTLLSGDFAGDFLDKAAAGGVNRLAGLFHAVTLSTRSAHHLGHASFPALFARSASASAPSPGALLLVETGRNVPLLSGAQREEMLKRVVTLGARAGAVVLGGDRALSADTFAVGTVISPGEVCVGGRGGAEAAQAQAPGALYFAAPPGGTPPAGPCAAPEVQVHSDATFAGRPAAFTGKYGASAVVGGGGEGEGAGEAPSGTVRPMRAKCGGMASFSHSEAPMAAVGDFLRAAGADGGSGGGGALKAAAAAAAATAWGLASGVGKHACWGGDNPAPEAVAFAYLGGRVAGEVAEAFRELEAAAAPAPAGSALQ